MSREPPTGEVGVKRVKQMTTQDHETINELIETLTKSGWRCHAVLPFLSDGSIHGAFVAQKTGEDRWYTFRAYSTIAGGGIEHHARSSDAEKALAELQDAVADYANQDGIVFKVLSLVAAA